MALADIRPGRSGMSERRAGPAEPGSRPGRGTRREGQAGPRDGLALGLAQAAALIPGVSRNGATLTAARARGFARADSVALSWHAALPVILGASTLKAWRLWRRGIPEGAWPALATGTGSAFVSTLASARLLRRPRVSARGLAVYAVYRCTIAAIAIEKLCKDSAVRAAVPSGKGRLTSWGVLRNCPKTRQIARNGPLRHRQRVVGQFFRRLHRTQNRDR